jgi:hypothetical protein
LNEHPINIIIQGGTTSKRYKLLLILIKEDYSNVEISLNLQDFIFWRLIVVH